MDPRAYGLGSHANMRSSPPFWGHERRAEAESSSFPERLPAVPSHASEGNKQEAVSHKANQTEIVSSPSSSDNDGRSTMRSRRSSHRKQSPGIDVALRNLNEEVNDASKLYKAVVEEFEKQISALVDWAEGSTLDAVWKNKVKDKRRDRREGEKFGGVADRFSNCRGSIQDAIAKAERVKPMWKDKHQLDVQIRTAKNALVYCDGLIELAAKSSTERVASRQLIQEFAETSDLLQRGRQPWIYGYWDAKERVDGKDTSRKNTEKLESGGWPKMPEKLVTVGNSTAAEKKGADGQAREGGDALWPFSEGAGSEKIVAWDS